MKKNIVIAVLSVAVMVLAVLMVNRKPIEIEKRVEIEKPVPVEVEKVVEVEKAVEIPVYIEIENDNLYPLCGVVTSVDFDNNIVTFTCHNGNQFAFTGCEDWMDGDTVAVIMDSNGTDIVTDDIVTAVRYCG